MIDFTNKGWSLFKDVPTPDHIFIFKRNQELMALAFEDDTIWICDCNCIFPCHDDDDDDDYREIIL